MFNLILQIQALRGSYVKYVENVNNILSGDPHKKIEKLVNRTGISYGGTYAILYKKLELSKVTAKWITHEIKTSQ